MIIIDVPPSTLAEKVDLNVSFFIITRITIIFIDHCYCVIIVNSFMIIIDVPPSTLAEKADLL